MTAASPTNGDRQRRLWRAWLGVLAVIAVVLYWPSLSFGYLADDLYQIAVLDGLYGEHPPMGLYFFALEDPQVTAAHVARGSLPWWTLPEFRFAHLRPLSSLLISLDHALWPRQPLPHHLHSLVWLMATLLTASLLLRRATTAVVAALALGVFAIDETIAWTMTWLANRCAMVSATFAFAALAVHLRRVDDPDPRLGWAELGLWALAFAAGEYAACGVAYAVAFVLVGRGGRWRSRVSALAPVAVATAGYALAYVWIGAGVYGASSYADPLGVPVDFVARTVDRVPRMLGEIWLVLPGQTEWLYDRYKDTVLLDLVFWETDPTNPVGLSSAHAQFAALAVALVVIPTWLLARRFVDVDERRAVAWTALGSLGALVPLAAIPPVTRSLLLAGLGPAVFVATVVVAMVRAWRRHGASGRGRAPAIALAVLATGMALQHTVADAFWVRAQLRDLKRAERSYRDFYLNPATKSLVIEGKHVVVIATPGLVTGIHGLAMLNMLGQPMPASWHVLAMGERPYLVRRHDAHTIELASIGSSMHTQYHEALFRPPDRILRVGDTVDVGLFHARVVHERPDDGPDAVLFAFDRPLDDPSLVFLMVGPHGLQPLELPSNGRAVPIPAPQLPGGLRYDR